MKPILTAGIALGVLVAIWTFFMGFTGWHRNPEMDTIFIAVAALINIGVIVWGLMQTAKDGRRYWSQVGAGVLIGVVGAVLIFCASLLFTTVAFPGFSEERMAGHAERLEAHQLDQADIDAQLEVFALAETPIVHATTGTVGTLVTSFVVALITAAFVRAK
jgi:hypothetical protein